MRSQRPALGLLLAWLALLSMVLASVSGLTSLPGDHAHAAQPAHASLPIEAGHPPGTPCAEQDEPPAKPRRATLSTLAKATVTPPAVSPRSGVQLIIELLLAAPPQHQPSIVEAAATPLPTPPGLRMQRGQAPPTA